MFKLIKNELYKIFHKKSTIITLTILFLFVVLVTILYAKMDTQVVIQYGDEEEIKSLEEKVANYPKESNIGEYAYLLSSLETEKYVFGKKNTWQVEKYYKYIADKVYDYYEVLYVEEDEERAQRIRDNIDLMLSKIDNNEWQYFTNLDLEDIEANINYTLEQEGNLVDSARTLEVYEYQKYLLNYRLENNVSYEPSYLNDVLNEQEYLINAKIDYENAQTEELKESHKQEYAQFKENEYILEKKIDTINEQSLRGLIKNFFSEYLFLILIFVVMIAGSMISEEFSKGTIKSLLTLPYSRTKILLAKYLTTLLMIPFIVLFLSIMQMILGGIVFGFDTLTIPVIGYNFSLSSVEVMNLAKYFILNFLYNLPMLILLSTLAFALSTLLLSTAFAITLSLCGYIGSGIINAFAMQFKVKFLNYFVTTNWDFTYLLFGGASPFDIPWAKSLIICLIYLFIMIFVMLIVFKKRNVKNI